MDYHDPPISAHMRYLISADGPPISPVMGGGGWPPRAAWRSSWVGNDELVSRAGMGATQSWSRGRPAAYRPSMTWARSASLKGYGSSNAGVKSGFTSSSSASSLWASSRLSM